MKPTTKYLAILIGLFATIFFLEWLLGGRWLFAKAETYKIIFIVVTVGYAVVDSISSKD